MDFIELNRRFYAREPSEYFRQRLLNLVLVASEDADTGKAVDKGASFGLMRFEFDSEAEAHEEQVRSRRDAFVAAEAEVLYHHISEVLVRLLLAHDRWPACPWVELTALTDFREFKRTVKEIRDILRGGDNDVLSQVASGIYAAGLESPHPQLTGIQWKESLDTARRVVLLACDHLLEASHVYNAAKHGFGVAAGTSAFSMHEADDLACGIRQEGPSILYLKRVEKVGSNERWQLVTDWVEPERLVGLSHMALDLVDSIHSTGRAVYLGEMHPVHSILLKKDLDDILSHRIRGGVRRIGLNFDVTVG